LETREKHLGGLRLPEKWIRGIASGHECVRHARVAYN
jgi:hypothetical protein